MGLSPSVTLALLASIVVSQAPEAKTSVAFLMEAEKRAQAGKWSDAFDSVDDAIKEGHKQLQTKLDDLSKQNPAGIEHEVTEYVNKQYTPIFFYGISLAARAPSSDKKLKEEIAKRSAYWILNAKSVSRDVLGGFLFERKLVAPPLTEIASLQTSLPEKSVLVVYLKYTKYESFDQFGKNGSEFYVACAIPSPPGATYFAQVGSDQEIDGLIREIYPRLDNFKPTRAEAEKNLADIPAFNAQMQRLTTKLLGGLKDAGLDMDGAQRWLLSPTADIWLVPFPAMPIEKGKGTRDANTQITYAIEDHDISYEISGRDLLKDNFKPQAGNKTFVMGLPDFSAPLPLPIERAQVTSTNHAPRSKMIKLAYASSHADLSEQMHNAVLSDVGPFDLHVPKLSLRAKLAPTQMQVRSRRGQGFYRCFHPMHCRPCPPMYYYPCPPICYYPCPPMYYPCPPLFGPWTPEKPRNEKASLLGGDLEFRYDPLGGGIALLPKHIVQALQAPNITDADAIPWLRANAREDVFINAFRPNSQEHFDVVSLVTHGFYLSLDPTKSTKGSEEEKKVNFYYKPPDPLMRCGAVLAGYNNRPTRGTVPELIEPGRNDGILTANEVVNNCRFVWNDSGGKQRTDLVVLVCCLGSNGQVEGDSLASFRFAFTKAGARIVLSAGWKIEPNSATEIIEQFFESRRGGADNVTALRKSQQSYLRNHKGEKRHPYYWSTFSLTH